jgi:hypothetical protein
LSLHGDLPEMFIGGQANPLERICGQMEPAR